MIKDKSFVSDRRSFGEYHPSEMTVKVYCSWYLVFLVLFLVKLRNKPGPLVSFFASVTVPTLFKGIRKAKIDFIPKRKIEPVSAIHAISESLRTDPRSRNVSQSFFVHAFARGEKIAVNKSGTVEINHNLTIERSGRAVFGVDGIKRTLED